MNRILVLFAHPAFQKSRINVRLKAAIDHLDFLTVHDLYDAYPEFDIDVAREQALLADHDVVAFHHPFFWYSTPAILKEWQDLVLEHGWAYGSTGTALDGKIFLNIITTGGRAAAYTPDGFNGLTVRQLLAPIERTALLCNMRFLPPFTVSGTHSIDMDEVDNRAEQLAGLLTRLHQNRLDIDAAGRHDTLNDYLTTLSAESSS